MKKRIKKTDKRVLVRFLSKKGSKRGRVGVTNHDLLKKSVKPSPNCITY